jgi:hypothetical protein
MLLLSKKDNKVYRKASNRSLEQGGVKMKQPKHPCINCIYFKACGETTRTMPCKGRMTKSEKKKESETK